MDRGAPKNLRTQRKPANSSRQQQQEEGQGEGGPKMVDVSVDMDVLECPLCFSPFESSIFQCKNGHAACEACCLRVQRVCPTCGEPTGDIRCLPLERAIAGLSVPCAFRAHGCARRLAYAERRAHEALLCPHAPCACPLPGCAYSGLRLHAHIQDAHAAAGGGSGGGVCDGDDGVVVSFARSTRVALRRGAPFRVLLHEVDSRVFLLLNGGDVPSGRSLSVVCVGARPAGGRALEYELEVGGEHSLSASGPVPCTRRWAGHHPTEGFLFVPDAYWGSSGSISVTVRVRTQTVDKA